MIARAERVIDHRTEHFGIGLSLHPDRVARPLESVGHNGIARVGQWAYRKSETLEVAGAGKGGRVVAFDLCLVKFSMALAAAGRADEGCRLPLERPGCAKLLDLVFEFGHAAPISLLEERSAQQPRLFQIRPLRE